MEFSYLSRNLNARLSTMMDRTDNEIQTNESFSLLIFL